MRTADKPGTYRIRQKGPDWVLSGMTRSGKRIKIPFDTENDARGAVNQFFPPPTLPANVVKPPEDDWGLPIIGTDTLNSVAQAMGVPSQAQTATLPPGPPLPQDLPSQDLPDPAEEKRKRDNQERAKTLCEFFGVAWASGDVWIARRMTESLNKKPVNPSTKQVNKLADSATAAFVSLFGDREIGPWTMLMLLSISLPIAMIVQSPPKKPEELESRPGAEPSSHLSAV